MNEMFKIVGTMVDDNFDLLGYFLTGRTKCDIIINGKEAGFYGIPHCVKLVKEGGCANFTFNENTKSLEPTGKKLNEMPVFLFGKQEVDNRIELKSIIKSGNGDNSRTLGGRIYIPALNRVITYKMLDIYKLYKYAKPTNFTIVGVGKDAHFRGINGNSINDIPIECGRIDKGEKTKSKINSTKNKESEKPMEVGKIIIRNELSGNFSILKNPIWGDFRIGYGDFYIEFPSILKDSIVNYFPINNREPHYNKDIINNFKSKNKVYIDAVKNQLNSAKFYKEEKRTKEQIAEDEKYKALGKDAPFRSLGKSFQAQYDVEISKIDYRSIMLNISEEALKNSNDKIRVSLPYLTKPSSLFLYLRLFADLMNCGLVLEVVERYKRDTESGVPSFRVLRDNISDKALFSKNIEYVHLMQITGLRQLCKRYGVSNGSNITFVKYYDYLKEKYVYSKDADNNTDLEFNGFVPDEDYAATYDYVYVLLKEGSLVNSNGINSEAEDDMNADFAAVLRDVLCNKDES